MDPSSHQNARWRPFCIRALTGVAHGVTPFLSAFLLIHLSAPVAANLGGSSLASKTMLLGREYYQTAFGEKYLLLAPLGIHTVSVVLKRLLSPCRRCLPRHLTTALSITGYSALLFVPIHLITHRLYPMQPAAPIFSLGPSELDYEFVKYGLRTWPWRSWFLYTGLVVCTVLHAREGMRIVWNQYLRPTFGRQNEERWSMIAIAGIILPVLAGVYAISAEPMKVFIWTTKRFRAIFHQSFIYRL